MIQERFTIGLDADDTLWHNERYFVDVTAQFVGMCRHYIDEPDLESHLATIERHNLALFGYGAKGFTLSLIETAIDATDGRVSARDLQRCIDWGRWILAHPVELLDGVQDVLEALADKHHLIMITKGDLLHQEAKVAGSGLAALFGAVEIVNEKDPATYGRVLAEHNVICEQFVMVGNSVKSDVLPVLEIGARAVHIPYETTWAHELVSSHSKAFPTLGSIRELPDLLLSLS